MRSNQTEEQRWALGYYSNKRLQFLLGKYCWLDADENSPKIPTFRTRQEARDAKKHLTSYRKPAQPVRVTISYLCSH